MDFKKWAEVLTNTPKTLSSLFHNLSDEWINANEGENTWNAKEVLAHLIVCEETNWLPRAKIILAGDEQQVFTPINMEAHFQLAENNPVRHLLEQFNDLRSYSIRYLKDCKLREEDLSKTALHPVMGAVTLRQILATWVAHDMTHISQIARIIAKQNKDYVGSFERYLRILK
ncbi:DinB family protein [Daejeonella lutea]|uniref:DinB superfamily protein n=1 Tax=Daejeonella lutea TaxID=572036 RepID=A0A1T5AYJ2_9SPHI|nr:DinB family protein [Daejeonella lutea]SKB40055.1 DinB superfamily protein [Daejeonella lutea]